MTHPAQKEWALRRPTTSLTHAGHVLAPRWEAIKAASTWTKTTNPKSQEFSPSQDAAVADEISFNDLSQSMHGHSWALVYSAWLHNHFSVKRAMTSYKRKTGRFYSQKIGYLKTSLKRLPQWTKGMWLGKTMSNDFHIIGTPSGIIITRSIRNFLTMSTGSMVVQTYGSQSCPFAALSRTFRTL